MMCVGRSAHDVRTFLLWRRYSAVINAIYCKRERDRERESFSYYKGFMMNTDILLMCIRSDHVEKNFFCCLPSETMKIYEK